MPAAPAVPEAAGGVDLTAAAVAISFDEIEGKEKHAQNWSKKVTEAAVDKVDGRDMAAVRSVAIDVRRRLHLLMNSKDRCTRLQEDEALMDANKFPSNHKPFNLPFECQSWDTPCSHAGKTLELRFPVGCTMG